jgi:hypothetical protein
VYEKWGGWFAFKFGLLSWVTQNWLTATTKSSYQHEFFLGATYWISPRFKLRGGISLMFDGANFSSNTLSQNTMTFAPALLYYF